MEYLRICGGNQLNGTVTLSGAKNSLLPILAAGILCSETVTLLNVPNLSDLQTSLQILRAVGWQAEFTERKVVLSPAENISPCIPQKHACAMRSSVFYLAPLLHRIGKVQLPGTGGCRLGERPIDIHLEGLVKMGATAQTQGDSLFLEAKDGLHGTNFHLRYPSVGATETLMMAAVLAEGTTCLMNVAKEPEVVDLAEFLNKCGAKIYGAGTDCLNIEGVNQLYGAVHSLIPDRIAAATLLSALVCAKGKIHIKNISPAHLSGVLNLYQKMGMTLYYPKENELIAEMPKRPNALGNLETAPFPAFCTDAAPLIAAAALTATGETRINDTVFENRFECAAEFSRMGAAALKQGREIHIWGKENYKGANVQAKDLRGGAALICAALAAHGESKVYGLEYIRRGYADLEQILAQLGAKIKLVQE